MQTIDKIVGGIGIVFTLVGTDILANGLMYSHDGKMIFGATLTVIGLGVLNTTYNAYQEYIKK